MLTFQIVVTVGQFSILNLYANFIPVPVRQLCNVELLCQLVRLFHQVRQFDDQTIKYKFWSYTTPF